jgi:hypothetical protein
LGFLCQEKIVFNMFFNTQISSGTAAPQRFILYRQGIFSGVREQLGIDPILSGCPELSGEGCADSLKTVDP